MTKAKKKFNSFSFVLIANIIFFSTAILLSIPVFFDYKSLEGKIEKKINKEFKINIKIIDDISYKIFPKPHLLIKNANLSLNEFENKSAVVEVENLKLWIPIKFLYSKSDLNMDALEIINANFKFKFKDLKDFRNHLFYKINKPIKIKKSKFFFVDNSGNTVLISPISNLNYFINKQSKIKQLKIKGNIFDINYNSKWKRHYDNPQQTFNEIKFRNPNIYLKNTFNFVGKSNFFGKSNINFLNEDIIINYKFKDNKILITSPVENKNLNIILYSNINLNPFDFETQITFINKNINFFIDDLLYLILNAEKEFLGNINGKLTLQFNNLDNEIVNNGKIDFLIKEKNIEILNSNFEIKDIGNIKSEIEYYEDKGDLIFVSKNVLGIQDKIAFSRKFQLIPAKIKKINQIFFDIKKNIESGEITISNIHINKVNLKKKI